MERLFSRLKYVLLTFLFVSTSVAFADVQDEMLLPEDFKVYTKEHEGVVNHNFDGAKEVTLPTVNAFKDKPGCYVACYSKDATHGVYPVDENIYVIGQMRVAGHYLNRICKPQNFKDKDISAEETFKKQCTEHFPKQCAEHSCWAGGDTGGWFGIQ